MSKKGFSFIEILVVIAILLILVALSVLTFKKLQQSASHRVISQEIYTMLSNARNNSIASDNDTVYGVHFEATSTTYFIGDTYSPSDSSNVQLEFSGGVYETSSLISSNTDIVFKRLTGFPTASGTIYIIRGDNAATNTITVQGTGLIQK